MTDKKKKYLAPEMSVIEINQADIIATSTTTDPGFFGIPTGSDAPSYEESPW